MKKIVELKSKVDRYFELEGNCEGQCLYYGMITVMILPVAASLITKIL